MRPKCAKASAIIMYIIFYTVGIYWCGERMTKRRTIVEKPEGHGHIQMPDGKRFRVRYALVVLRVTDDEADTAELTSHYEVRGAAEATHIVGTIDLSEKTFKLQIDDGRCLE